MVVCGMCARTSNNFLSYSLEGKAIAFPWHAGILVAFQNVRIPKHSLPPSFRSKICNVHYTKIVNYWKWELIRESMEPCTPTKTTTIYVTVVTNSQKG